MVVEPESAAGVPVSRADLEELRRRIPALPPFPRPEAPRNRCAVFLLSPPRSGSTLLRVLLAGHPGLFAPPELELLGFNTMGERRAAFSGRYAFWREGLVRAWMELTGEPAEAAGRALEEMEERDLPVRAVYRELQERLGGRTLVDKTPSYALDPATLARAEEDFEEPLYIHLLRHPGGVIASFEEARLEQVFFRHENPFPRRKLAELIWTASHENIGSFLASVPAARQHRLRFEELVQDPRETLERLCGFLGIDFDSALLDPYGPGRMTDGIHPLSPMIGDVKFQAHRAIDPDAAERWRERVEESSLGAPTHECAALLGYAPSPLVPLQTEGTGTPWFLVHPVGGHVLAYRELARRLSGPVYGLQARGLTEGEEPLETIEALAESYLEALRTAAPPGPYRLGGWSIGGAIAFEMARRLRETGETVEVLAMIDTVEPGAARLRDEPEENFEAWLQGARQAGLLPPAVTDEAAQRYWRVHQVNARAFRAWRPGVYAGKVRLIAAAESTPRGELGETLGWERWAEVEALTVEGGHYDLLGGGAVGRVARWLEG
jgi:thioesterase domain-containing protein